MSKFIDFYNSHLGHMYGNGQCVDGLYEYVRWGTGTWPYYPGAGAQDIGYAWKSNGLSTFCTDVTSETRKDGDILFLSSAQAGGNGYGHVAMYYQGKLFGQNQNTDGGGGPFNAGVPVTSYFLALRPNFITSLAWIIPSTSRALSSDEQLNNAKCVYGYLTIKYGWSLQAICGVLGNMTVESTINPNRWQSDIEGSGGGGGFGLIQWTPYTVITAHLTGHELSEYGNIELDVVHSELVNNSSYYPTSSYPVSGGDFIKSTADPKYLALVYLANRERPADPAGSAGPRQSAAQSWYDILSKLEPIMPDGATDSGGGTSYAQIICVNGLIIGGSSIPGTGNLNGTVDLGLRGRIIWVGDSRFVGMQQSVSMSSQDIVIASVGQGYSWFVNTAISQVQSNLQVGDKIIVNLGVNDPGNVGSYVSKMAELTNGAWKEHNVFYMSVNPIDDSKAAANGYLIRNSNVVSFNDYFSKHKPASVAWHDTYSYLAKSITSRTTDGIHYNTATYQDIYNLVR